MTQIGKKLNSKRYISESALEANIAKIVTPIANDMGYELVRVKILNDKGIILQIMAEDRNGNFSITDCEKLSRELSPALDAEEPIKGAYSLEVSSPGIDRPLVRAKDFANYVGHEAKIELKNMLDGRKRFRGEIIVSDENSVTLKLQNVPSTMEQNYKIKLEQIASAKLIMSDKLLEQARKKQQNYNSLDSDNIEIITEEYQK